MGRGRVMGRGSAESRLRGMGRGSAGEEFRGMGSSALTTHPEPNNATHFYRFVGHIFFFEFNIVETLCASNRPVRKSTF